MKRPRRYRALPAAFASQPPVVDAPSTIEIRHVENQSTVAPRYEMKVLVFCMLTTIRPSSSHAIAAKLIPERFAGSESWVHADAVASVDSQIPLEPATA